MGTTLLLLLSLWPSLASALEFDPRVVVRGDYNMAKVSGVWHSISMASDDLKRIEEDGDLRVFIQTIQHLRNGSLRFSFLFKVQGECVPVDVVCKKTEKDGEYSIAYKGENKVTIPETDYQLYVTFRLQNLRNGTETQVLALYGRIPQLDPSFLDRFKKICKKYGLSSGNIIDMTNQDDCFSK
ncbi:epididymal-specific lipocalin-9 [Eulemur rufifrons]|uniref:epididymal-specific lipocalin-9 n=1 Tax=Eulemur rufifrons TaxID=859984 RepID=UPI003743CD29